MRALAIYSVVADDAFLECALLLPSKPEPGSPEPGSGDWPWCAFKLALRNVVRAELARGGRLQAPGLRQSR
ncbi:MAG: hypothetical protein H5U00_10240 [Clostridia bacterium]|nr:hypothetical protein [Clostridia bacterium]